MDVVVVVVVCVVCQIGSGKSFIPSLGVRTSRSVRSTCSNRQPSGRQAGGASHKKMNASISYLKEKVKIVVVVVQLNVFSLPGLFIQMLMARWMRLLEYNAIQYNSTTTCGIYLVAGCATTAVQLPRIDNHSMFLSVWKRQ